MSDQGKWWKLWLSALDDDDLENLSIHEWFAWARFGCHVKGHGKNGKIRLRAPGLRVVNLLRVADFASAINMIKKFPNVSFEDPESVTVGGVATYSVKFKNWNKYSGDYSGDRVKKYRKSVTTRQALHVTPQEEKREEEKRLRRDETKTPYAPDRRVAELIELFFKNLEVKTGEKPVINGAELGKGFKNLLRTFEAQEVGRRITAWFASDEPFVVKTNWRFSEFNRNFNKLKEGPIHATANRPANAFVATSGESAKYDARNK